MPLMQSGCPVQLGLISYDVPRVGVHYSDTCVILGPKISLLCRLVKTVRVVSLQGIYRRVHYGKVPEEKQV